VLRSSLERALGKVSDHVLKQDTDSSAPEA